MERNRDKCVQPKVNAYVFTYCKKMEIEDDDGNKRQTEQSTVPL